MHKCSISYRHFIDNKLNLTETDHWVDIYSIWLYIYCYAAYDMEVKCWRDYVQFWLVMFPHNLMFLVECGQISWSMRQCPILSLHQHRIYLRWPQCIWSYLEICHQTQNNPSDPFCSMTKIILTWISNHMHIRLLDNFFVHSKLQQLYRWSLGMDKQLHLTIYNGCNYYLFWGWIYSLLLNGVLDG